MPHGLLKFFQCFEITMVSYFVMRLSTHCLFQGETMKEGIHPKYMETVVTCGCGETFTTRSTKPKIAVEVCSKCHPFYTGKQKFVDSAGQIERFQKRLQKRQKTEEPAKQK